MSTLAPTSIIPSRLRNRSRSRSVAEPLPSPSSTADVPAQHNIIHFPRVYEQAWGGYHAQSAVPGLSDSRTDLERAQIFLLRFTQLSPDRALQAALMEIVVDRDRYVTVYALADAVRMRIFGGRHQSFEVTPLLQAMRFMLIKAGITDCADPNTRPVVDFFFDPTMARNQAILPTDAVTLPYPAARLKVCIVGGGPTALASAISLAEKGKGQVEVHMYERRWVSTQEGGRVGYPPTAKRRDQVVTLQESVTDLITPRTRTALFQNRPEKVWPGSANIQIRKVEDRLLARCHDDEFRGLIHLYAQGLTRETLYQADDFHVLLGADGAASWVRKSYFHGYENERGKSYALGLAFDRPAGLPWSQPLNVFLTLGQTRYLLNASDHDGRGYLNMQLTEAEWHEMVSVDGTPVTFGRPGCLPAEDGSLPAGFEPGQLFRPSTDRQSPLWQSIEDGLKLFGFKESEVINVVRILIVVQAVGEGVQYLPHGETPSLRRPHALVAVAGDAAMTVHFWPGRGLNSGIKSGMALGDELVHALDTGRFVGLGLDSMKEYNDFIMKLQGREHDKRSIPILNQSGAPETLGWLLDKAGAVPDQVAVEWLVGAMVQIASRLETRRDWPFEVVPNIAPQIRIVLRQLRARTLREMAVSFPWPTREMGGAEVLPLRSMKVEEKQRWMQGLWKMMTMRDEGGAKDKENAAKLAAAARLGEAPSTSRFEAPKSNGDSNKRNSLQVPGQVPGQAPGGGGGGDGGLDRGLKRSGAMSIRSPGGAGGVEGRRGRASSITSEVSALSTSREPSPASSGEIGLVRLMSTRKPGKAVFDDALSLALFRLDEDR
ncbi:uncharacterized protein J7T54_005166 [Emericellopsis cladophorae]|uniref:FAD/NAD(P)-binding domain-containing protein n=1 Tax=Emericellopsis cladophorae TaxID=2686198 RepID=A0A9Q0BET9_9HYPO|nr:uncharacterized protein J7T54_005166 [Emericellopsis cladophorae]KAI6781955.1 hypothetical protein J7T54_005166 [Emericellopsis cladophorae]